MRFAREYGVNIEAAMARHPRYPVDSDPNPFVLVDRNKCIQCLRCVRPCAEIQGRFVWSQSYRGYQARIVAGDDSTMLASRCESCGACVAYCPAGALDNKMSITAGRPDRLVRTTCTYCGVGCQLDLNVKGEKIIRVTSATGADGSSINGMHLCVKGRYGYEFVHHPRRHAGPRVREYLLKGESRPAGRGKLVEVDWDTALDIVARKLGQLREEGSAKIGVLASGRMLNEESYLLGKLARQALGTNHIDLASSLYYRDDANSLLDTLGLPAMTNSLEDVAAHAQAFFVIGSNLTEQHPVFGARIRQNILRRHIKMVVSSPDFINLEEYAALTLRHRPGAAAALINGLMNIILEKGWQASSSREKFPKGLKEAKAVIGQYTPGRVTELTGIPTDQLYRAAEILASHHPTAVLYGPGISHAETVHALSNLQLLLGNLGLEGGGINTLRAQNNTREPAIWDARPATCPALFGVLAIILGVIGSGAAAIIEMAKEFEATLALFLGIFFSLLLLSCGLFLILAMLSAAVYGSAHLAFDGMKSLAALKASLKYIFAKPASIALYGFLMFCYVLIGFVVLLVGSPLALVPVIGSLLSLPYQIFVYAVQCYVSLVMLASSFAYYFKTGYAAPVPVTIEGPDTSRDITEEPAPPPEVKEESPQE